MKPVELTPEERKFLGEVADLNALFRYDSSGKTLLSIAEKIRGDSSVKRACEVSLSGEDESAIIPILRYILAREVPLIARGSERHRISSDKRLSAAILGKLLP